MSKNQKALKNDLFAYFTKAPNVSKPILTQNWLENPEPAQLPQINGMLNHHTMMEEEKDQNLSQKIQGVDRNFTSYQNLHDFEKSNSQSTEMEIEDQIREIVCKKELIENTIKNPRTSPLKKQDFRKGNSGRKTKSLLTILKEYKEDINFKGWLLTKDLEVDGINHKYFYCSWCSSLEKTNQLAKGLLWAVDGKICSSFSSTRLKEHAKENKQHKEAKEAVLLRKFNITQPEIPSNISDYPQLSNLFEFILVSVNKNLSINCIVELVQFFLVKGFSFPSHYTCHKSIREITTALAEEKQAKLAEEISNSPFFSLAIDGSTDISSIKSHSINILYIHQQKPKWVYLGSLFSQTCTAKSVYKALTGFFAQHNIDYKKKLVGFCTDGEKMLRSQKNGVHSLLKKDVPGLIGLHCLAHSFSLANKTDLSQDFPILDELFDLAYQTYQFIHKSPKRLDKLFEKEKEVEELISELSLVKPIKIRWLSLFNAITRISKLLKAIILSLKESNELTAKMLLSRYEKPQFLAWIFFLTDLTPDLKFITTLFQEKYFNMRITFSILKSMKENMHRKYIDSFNPGNSYTYFASKFKTINEKVIFDDCLVMQTSFQSNSYQLEFKEFCTKFLIATDKRFQDLYEIGSFEFFDLQYLKRHAEDSDILAKFQSHILGLLSKLKIDDEADEILNNYHYIIDYFKDNVTKEDDITTLYRELLLNYENLFPNLLKLITIYQILPLSNVECERTFSEYNRTKTRLRSLMEEDLVSSLLQLSMNCKDSNDHQILIRSAIQRWRTQRSRLFFNDIPESN